MRRILSVSVFLLVFITTLAQPGEKLQRPKLVVGIVVDQMRWDFLYRYYDRYTSDGGFKRLMTQGFNCDNTFIPYAPTVTAPGHTSIYTGTVPAVHGIAGNFWWDIDQRRDVYCTEDTSVKTVGSSTIAGLQSPRNMLVTTIGDELRLATNFQSKVIGIAIKDRGGILTAGQSANAAYWYDPGVGNWISSTYYMKDLPQWVKNLNERKLVDKYYDKGWSTLYPLSTYLQSTADEKTFESKMFGKGFPYDLKQFKGRSYGAISSTPHGNTFTIDMAKAAIEGENLGVDAITDLLAVSFSAPDYIGHSFGPNSIEQEDDFLRLDKDLGDFLDYLDNRIGKGQYTVFLSADHGVAQVPAFMAENKLPAGKFTEGAMLEQLNQLLKDQFGIGNLALNFSNYQLALNNDIIKNDKKLDREEIIDACIGFLSRQESVIRAFDLNEIGEVPLPVRIKQMIENGYYPKRGGDIQIIFKSNYIENYSPTGTTHGMWNPYDSHIPLLWYGWGIKPGKTNREIYMTDIAPTLAALLHIQMPSGTIGTVIHEVLK
ncbi:MAG TPA: alkaline phosphatase PafA [Chitinophagaceae bacterium]|nr:alkaline phosphatase PafA [Chitinophagaceae bacterium]